MLMHMAEATVVKQMLAISPHEDNDFVAKMSILSKTKGKSADHQSILKLQRVNDWEKT